MKLTRTGYNLLVIVWLAPLVAFDLIGNTTTTGTESDFFYYKFMADMLIGAYAAFSAFGRQATASRSTALNKQQDPNDSVMSFEHLGAAEYIYCLVLAAYSAVNWFELHTINKSSEGLISMGSLVWSFVSLAVAVLSVIQFWHIKSGAIVALKKQVVQ